LVLDCECALEIFAVDFDDIRRVQILGGKVLVKGKEKMAAAGLAEESILGGEAGESFVLKVK